jgi:hypothetical protein
MLYPSELSCRVLSFLFIPVFARIGQGRAVHFAIGYSLLDIRLFTRVGVPAPAPTGQAGVGGGAAIQALKMAMSASITAAVFSAAS